VELRRGDLIEEFFSNQKSAKTPALTTATFSLTSAHCAPHPSAFLFLVNGDAQQPDIVQLKNKQHIVQYFASGYEPKSKAFAPFFDETFADGQKLQQAQFLPSVLTELERKIETHGVNAYIVNVAPKGKMLNKQEFTKLMGGAVDGTLVSVGCC